MFEKKEHAEILQTIKLLIWLTYTDDSLLAFIHLSSC